MFIEERLNKILKLVQDSSRVTVREARDFLEVSADTVRRDFDRLSEKGLVLRTHGGIMSKESVAFDPDVTQRIDQHQSEKDAIGRKAADLIADSEIVVIDAGTTTERVVKYLVNSKDLTVLTNALNVAVEATRKNINTIILGGIIRNSTLGIIGPDTVDMIRHYHADKLVMGVSAMHASKGFMTPNRMEAEIKKELVKIANQVIIVADHSKIGKTALFSFASLDEINVLVTDKGADPVFLKVLQDHDIEILLAD
jgi:DeoR/GlpR family transcriptional regulator of sugar metabolism